MPRTKHTVEMTPKEIGERALNRVKKTRAGKKFKLVKHPVKGMIEVEVGDE